MRKACAVVLAAGDGKRMKSSRSKVLCEVLFKPMISWVADSLLKAGISDCCAVVAPGADEVVSLLPEGFRTAVQEHRLGTGHAASMAADFIRSGGYDDVAVLFGDAPFFTPEDLLGGLAVHREKGFDVTAYAATVENPAGYGRMIQENGFLTAVVEEKDADGQTKAIRDINAGVHWFRAGFLLDFFENMKAENAQKEYYLTSCVDYAARTGRKAGLFMVEPSHVAAANDRRALRDLNELARRSVLDRHLDAGVNIPFEDGVVIGADVEIGPDTTILPGAILKGKTVIGEHCEIGPDTRLTDARLGDGCHVLSSVIDSSSVGSNARIGPWCNIRPGCDVGAGAKLGDFVELKNSVIGEKTSVAHLTYIGDSDVGARCNFGCGVVTANYDGKNKYRTKVGDDCFIGCNCNFVPPVSMGDGAYAATGTTITEDVPAGAMVIGRVRQEVKEGWAEKRGLYRPKRG